jgi:phosphohistidine phosphatase
MSDRTLVLLRHAKAASPVNVADPQRGLTERGHVDAAAAGTWLAGGRLLPDVVVCSPARRARETWHGLAAALGGEASRPAVRYEPTLYRAFSGQELLDLITATEPETTTVLVVGHNPTLSMLSALLDPTADEGLRTCGIAVHRVPGPWCDLAPGGGPRTAAHTARA